jgi:nucleoside-diphosphate-sugar epimerase
VARLGRERGLDVTVTVRSEERAAPLRAEGFRVLASATLDESIAQEVDGRTHVVISFQPDPATDACVARAVAGAHSVAYVSSTGVFGDRRGVVNDASPLPAAPEERSRRILAAEDTYRAAGATILRCPAIYGPDRGLHVRILRGDHRIPGDGTHFISRIHIADLAQFALAAAKHSATTYVVGDREPARHIDVIRFVCDTYGVPMPPSVPLDGVHASLRADRQVDASRALSELGVTLAFPTYREGMSRAATSGKTGEMT